MGDAFDIDTSDLARLAATSQRAGAVVRDEITTATRRAGLGVQRGAQQAVRVDTGHLRRSVTSVVTPFSGGVRGVVGTNVPYGEVLDQGRRAGAAMPPVGALTGWLSRHGIAASAEYVVRRRIARKGIRGDRWLTGTFAKLRPDIRAEYRAATRRVVQRLKAGR